MTSISWMYDCLAIKEKEAYCFANSTHRLQEVSDIFRGRKILMLPASLNEICGCRVGIICTVNDYESGKRSRNKS